jgi:hypothetical protein
MKGIDKNGVPFVEYSEEYIKSLEFAIARKSPSQVNLRLTNEMLTDVEVIEVDSSSGTITVGITDPSSQAKAHGHITGAGGRLPVRDFMGISQKEFAAILSKVPDPENLARAEAEFRRRSKREEERTKTEQDQPQDRGFRPAGLTVEDVFGVIDEIANGVDIL